MGSGGAQRLARSKCGAEVPVDFCAVQHHTKRSERLVCSKVWPVPSCVFCVVTAVITAVVTDSHNSSVKE